MNKIPFQNISNHFSEIYYSTREGKDLQIKHVKSFSPFFYEPDSEGNYMGYDGTKLTKIHCQAPHEVKKRRTKYSYEADVLYTKRFVIENIDEINKSDTRYILYDIEVKAKDEFPNPSEAKYPITFIRVYDNYTKERFTFDYRNYKSEFEMLEEFCNYIKEKEPDLLLAWNHDGFDYPYIYNRHIDFAKKISPINMEQFKGKENPTLPALITIIDLLALDHKYTLGKRESYALDNVLQEEFKEEIEWGETDWEDDDKVKLKCENDVERMIKLIDKFDYINHFDEIRRETCCLWEDIPPKRIGYSWQSNNSKPIDSMFLKEAKRLNIVLPSKQQNLESEKYDGAYREVFQKGSMKDISKYDLSSAYPSAIVDFCLDPANLSDKEGLKIDVKDRITGEIKYNYYFKQNPNTILPTVVKKLLKMKDNLKLQVEQDPTNKVLEVKYATVKALINSLYGVLGNKYFRLYKKEVAETDTFLIRDLLHYVKAKIERKGYEVIYVDTDSFFVKGKKDISSLLNRYVLEWGMDKYRKKVNIEFAYEGYFEKLFILTLCRYTGYIRKPNGKLKQETKGIQAKRKDATKLTKKFQEELLEFILDGNKKEAIINFIKTFINNIQNVDLFDIGNPVKIQKPREDYKKKEIFFRALDSTKQYGIDLKKKIGQKFYWINVDSNYYAQDTETKDEINVMAFDEKIYKHITNVDYKAVIETQILNVLVPIFTNLNWGKELIDLAEEYEIILKSDYRNKLLAEYKNFEDLKQYYSARVAKKRIKEKILTKLT
jgi:DNA polymerase I